MRRKRLFTILAVASLFAALFYTAENPVRDQGR